MEDPVRQILFKIVIMDRIATVKLIDSAGQPEIKDSSVTVGGILVQTSNTDASSIEDKEVGGSNTEEAGAKKSINYETVDADVISVEDGELDIEDGELGKAFFGESDTKSGERDADVGSIEDGELDIEDGELDKNSSEDSGGEKDIDDEVTPNEMLDGTSPAAVGELQRGRRGKSDDEKDITLHHGNADASSAEDGELDIEDGELDINSMEDAESKGRDLFGMRLAMVESSAEDAEGETYSVSDQGSKISDKREWLSESTSENDKNSMANKLECMENDVSEDSTHEKMDERSGLTTLDHDCDDFVNARVKILEKDLLQREIQLKATNIKLNSTQERLAETEGLYKKVNKCNEDLRKQVCGKN